MLNPNTFAFRAPEDELNDVGDEALIANKSIRFDQSPEIALGMGACLICDCRGYKGISGQFCERCGHSPSDHK